MREREFVEAVGKERADNEVGKEDGEGEREKVGGA